MSPRAKPSSLLKISINSCLGLINSACYDIERSSANEEYSFCEDRVSELNCFLRSVLPGRLLDVLCFSRTNYVYEGDPRTQLHALMHPNQAFFFKCDLDNNIPQKFWLNKIPQFSKLLILDLKFSCTDEILQVIGLSCPLLEEVNVVSRVDLCKSPFNASSLMRYVSDAGLRYISGLKHIRILAMDSPRNERANRVGRCVTQDGIIMLLQKLPCLEELKIESCDIGSTLTNSTSAIGPLALKKMNCYCHFNSGDSVMRLIKICPLLQELSITHLSNKRKDCILDQITASDLKLCRLDLSFFSYTGAMHELLAVKGEYLTHFSLWDIENSLNLKAVLDIGRCCPNVSSLCLVTQAKGLVVPRFFTRKEPMFGKLRSLTLGNEYFDIKAILLFFLGCNQHLEKLMLKYQDTVDVDSLMLHVVERGYLGNLNNLWLDCTIQMTKETVFKIVSGCDKLRFFTANYAEVLDELCKFVTDNNLDVKLGGY